MDNQQLAWIIDPSRTAEIAAEIGKLNPADRHALAFTLVNSTADTPLESYQWFRATYQGHYLNVGDYAQERVTEMADRLAPEENAPLPRAMQAMTADHWQEFYDVMLAEHHLAVHAPEGVWIFLGVSAV